MTHVIVRLGDVAQFIRGITFKPTDVVEAHTAGSVVCMRTKNVQLDLDESDIFALPRSFVRRKDQFLQEGDLLISSANSWNLVGKCCWVKNLSYSATAGGFISILRGEPQKINPRYLYYWFSNPHTQELVRKCARQTTNISNLDVHQCLDLTLPLSSLSEQKRIAAILDEADILRRKRREAITKLNTLSESFLTEMLALSSNFKQVQLSDVCQFITKGTTPKSTELFPNEFDGAVPFLKVYNISQDGGIDFEEKRSFINSKYHEKELGRSKVYPGDVLMNIVGPPLGKMGLVPKTYPVWNINQAIAIFRPKKGLEPLYLLHALRSNQILPNILSQAVGIRQLNLSLQQCRAITIPLPPFRLQEEFASRVTEINSMREQQEVSLNRMEALFATLQHQAFSSSLTGTTAENMLTQPCLTLDF